jgi:integrase
LWHTGIRIGAAHGLDLEDYDPNEQYLKLRHRPDEGTRLKNKQDGERFVGLTADICDALDAYLKYNRIEGEDDFGRKPLFSSKYGRPNKSSLRDSIYCASRPCVYTGDCPHNREINSCEAMTDRDRASRCPSSVSPHAIRRGSITHHLSEDIPDKVVSDRMNVSLDVLEKHYDRRTEQQKADQRRDYLDEL